MKVICINAGPIKRKDGSISGSSMLKEGAIYTVIKQMISIYGSLGYLLLEVKGTHHSSGAFLAERFIPLSDIDEMELVKKRKKRSLEKVQ